ncbi:Piwi-domain-containing protein [Aspergillus ellipticus CBS 707.79]|uniref:Piwi-domain-containing protein n=1 Tax=Aspergillus ellipticus CBS 707.79 TaxID=1448320 RepID=A0A319EPG4_9EURO|nr:Piwi-domain-containing protein [Aspergillus ellipticus CBS 707.79]
MNDTSDIRPLQRPVNGTLGRRISLQTNYFELTFDADLSLYRYEVRVAHANQGMPTILGRQVATQVILHLLRTEFPEYHESIATDGYQNIISRHLLPLQDNPHVVYYQTNFYNVRLSPTGTLKFSQAYELVRKEAEGREQPPTESHMHALNIILGHHPKFSPHIRFIGTGTYLNLGSRMSLGSGLHTLHGLFLAAREAQGRLFVNVAPKVAICYDDCSLDRIILAYIRQNGSDMTKVAALVQNLRVQLTHLGMRKRSGGFVPRVKTVLGLAARDDGNGLAYPPTVPYLGAGAKEVRFYREPRSQDNAVGGWSRKRKRPLSEGYITVFEYFRSVHNITIDDPWLPVVNIGTVSNPSYLPAQVCRVVPGQAAPGSTHTAHRGLNGTPTSLASSMETELSSVLGLYRRSEGATLTSLGFSLAPGMIRVPGRVLDPPRINYRQGQRASVRAGEWSLREMRFAEGTSVSRWTYLWVSTSGETYQCHSERRHLEVAIEKFRTRMKMLGVNIPDACRPGLYVSLNLRRDDDMNKLAHALDTVRESSSSFLLIILSEQSEKLYSRIKFLCEVERGIRNVCVIGSKFLRANERFLSNVALKLNLKLGGINQTLPDRSLGIIDEGKTMVVGVDVTHPNSGNLPAQAPSVAAMVASVDRFLAQWPADMCTQSARQELVTNIDALLTSRLYLWRKWNRGKLPENILMYRDGVSDTQYGSVLGVELPRLRKACRDLYGSISQKEPRISIVIVGKRHHTRFFTPERAGGNDGRPPQSTNPPNGTVVDQGPISSSKVWDFYLQSHTASRGIARPGHYVVLLDEIFQPPHGNHQPRTHPNPANAIQSLTHNICYISGRATTASSICPPVFYADLACFRARFYVDEMLRRDSSTYPLELSLHENVRDTMFYI